MRRIMRRIMKDGTEEPDKEEPDKEEPDKEELDKEESDKEPEKEEPEKEEPEKEEPEKEPEKPKKKEQKELKQQKNQGLRKPLTKEKKKLTEDEALLQKWNSENRTFRHFPPIVKIYPHLYALGGLLNIKKDLNIKLKHYVSVALSKKEGPQKLWAVVRKKTRFWNAVILYNPSSNKNGQLSKLARLRVRTLRVPSMMLTLQANPKLCLQKLILALSENAENQLQRLSLLLREKRNETPKINPKINPKISLQIVLRDYKQRLMRKPKQRRPK